MKSRRRVRGGICCSTDHWSQYVRSATCLHQLAHHVSQLGRVGSKLLDASLVRLDHMNGIFAQPLDRPTVIVEGCRLLVKLGLDIASDGG